MKQSMENIWLAIILMAGLTYMTRSLPFLLEGRSRAFDRLTESDSPLSTLGPCLLMAIAAATILPTLAANLNAGGFQILPTAAGLLGTMLAMKLWCNVGLAVLVGMFMDALVFVAIGR
ncbi:MAG: AzlD domain-containing protein [Burkholderiales bacterium]|nr:AzlD domain-containing protein [Burkholderiales bacterium]